jgi:hypothetical protein
VAAKPGRSDVVQNLVASDATYVSLNTEDSEPNKILPSQQDSNQGRLPRQ